MCRNILTVEQLLLLNPHSLYSDKRYSWPGRLTEKSHKRVKPVQLQIAAGGRSPAAVLLPITLLTCAAFPSLCWLTHFSSPEPEKGKLPKKLQQE